MISLHYKSFCLTASVLLAPIPMPNLRGADIPVVMQSDEQIISEISRLLKSGDFSRLYEHLHRSYSSGVAKQEFIARLTSSESAIDELNVRSSYMAKGSGYMIVREVRNTPEGNVGRFVVLFLKNVDGAWYMCNFPFFPGLLPEFFREPCIVCDD